LDFEEREQDTIKSNKLDSSDNSSYLLENELDNNKMDTDLFSEGSRDKCSRKKRDFLDNIEKLSVDRYESKFDGIPVGGS